MSATNKTEKLGLSQFVGSDIPDWITDISADMLKIDEGFKEVDNNILNSMEEVEANTEENRFVGPDALLDLKEEVTDSLDAKFSPKYIGLLTTENTKITYDGDVNKYIFVFNYSFGSYNRRTTLEVYKTIVKNGNENNSSLYNITIFEGASMYAYARLAVYSSMGIISLNDMRGEGFVAENVEVWVV